MRALERVVDVSLGCLPDCSREIIFCSSFGSHMKWQHAVQVRIVAKLTGLEETGYTGAVVPSGASKARPFLQTLGGG